MLGGAPLPLCAEGVVFNWRRQCGGAPRASTLSLGRCRPTEVPGRRASAQIRVAVYTYGGEAACGRAEMKRRMKVALAPPQACWVLGRGLVVGGLVDCLACLRGITVVDEP